MRKRVRGRLGYFGEYGGQFAPETLMAPLAELEAAFAKWRRDRRFRAELRELLVSYAGRPTPLTFADRLSERCGGARIALKREDLLHTGAGGVEEAEQRVITATRGGVAIDRVQYGLDLADVEVAHDRSRVALERNRHDFLVLAGSNRVFRDHVLKEGSKRCQTEVPGGGAVLALLFNLLQEGQDAFGLQILQPQPGRGFSGTGSQEGKEQLQGVPIGQDRVRAEAPLSGQIVLEEGLNK